jgi:hypothetical protein
MRRRTASQNDAQVRRDGRHERNGLITALGVTINARGMHQCFGDAISYVPVYRTLGSTERWSIVTVVSNSTASAFADRRHTITVNDQRRYFDAVIALHKLYYIIISNPSRRSERASRWPHRVLCRLRRFPHGCPVTVDGRILGVLTTGFFKQ